MLTYATALFILSYMAKRSEIHILLHNIRSTYNVGSLFRTADGLGVHKLHLTGYTPYPEHLEDARLPHVRQRADKAIHKTALGAETTVAWQHYSDVKTAITNLRESSISIVALEQSPKSIPLEQFDPHYPICLILGSERSGLEKSVLADCDEIVEIPMNGKKESFNVSVAGAIAIHWLYRR